MKVGSEDRNKLIAAVVLLLLAILLIGRWLFTSSGPSAAAPPPPSPLTTAPIRRPVRVRPGAKATAPAQRSLDPTLRYDWLRASEDTKYEGTGRNIFQAQAEPPPRPIAPPNTDRAIVPELPSGPPPPPPIPFKFFGFANKPGEPRRVFLSKGEDVFIAGEGEIIDRRYKVIRITPTAVEMEDVLNNNRQSIPLTQ
ncbi:MAG: hypothetical protein JOY93_11135 [Acidobacteriales bacterium]|nr:hypothetical protein [Terriglobales bacterium]